jgi:hypothetical protein
MECRNCGGRIVDEEARFCSTCGAPVDRGALRDEREGPSGTRVEEARPALGADAVSGTPEGGSDSDDGGSPAAGTPGLVNVGEFVVALRGLS